MTENFTSAWKTTLTVSSQLNKLFGKLLLVFIFLATAVPFPFIDWKVTVFLDIVWLMVLWTVMSIVLKLQKDASLQLIRHKIDAHEVTRLRDQVVTQEVDITELKMERSKATRSAEKAKETFHQCWSIGNDALDIGGNMKEQLTSSDNDALRAVVSLSALHAELDKTTRKNKELTAENEQLRQRRLIETQAGPASHVVFHNNTVSSETEKRSMRGTG